MTTELVSTDRITPIRRLDPEDAIVQAKKWADALMRVVKDTRISVKIGPREYLKVEAWQTLARFNYCWIDTEWTRDIKDEEGRVLGVEARARLMSLDTGQCLGGAEGSCMMDEELQTQDGTVIERWSDYYAVKSMAQTRAQGKVGRMAYAWVAVLAGYESTPAEEMTGVRQADPQKNVCPQCQKPTIIKGRAEYGGGWLCFKKKGGCGAKFTDAEWEQAARPEKESHDVTQGADPAGPVSAPVETPSAPAEQSVNDLRHVLLGRITGLEDKLGWKAAQRAALWQKHCGHGTPETADPAALNDLYFELVAVNSEQ